MTAAFRFLLVLALAVLAVPAAAGGPKPGGELCGLVPPLDPLLCDPRSPTASAQEQSVAAAGIEREVGPRSFGPNPRFDRTRILIRFRRGTPAAVVARELT